MASAPRQELVEKLRNAGIESYPQEASTEELRKLYLVYAQAKCDGCDSLSDNELFQLLKAFGTKPGPVMASTRSTYQNRLQKMLNKPVAANASERNHISADVVGREERSTQLGSGLLSSFAKSAAATMPGASTPSPIRSNDNEEPKIPVAKSPKTSTPKREGSAAIGLFTNASPTAVEPVQKRTPPRQSRLLGDYSLSDIPSKAPASTVTRRSVWPTSQRPFVTEHNLPQKRMPEIFRSPLKSSQVNERNATTSKSTRTLIQIGVVVAIAIVMLFACVLFDGNPTHPVTS